MEVKTYLKRRKTSLRPPKIPVENSVDEHAEHIYVIEMSRTVSTSLARVFWVIEYEADASLKSFESVFKSSDAFFFGGGNNLGWMEARSKCGSGIEEKG